MTALACARSLRLVLLSSLLLSSAIAPRAVAQNAPLDLTIRVADGSAVLSWFAEDGLAYQLESSSDLVSFGDLGPVRIGTGAVIEVTQPIGAETRGFFRLKRFSIYAVFDPGTGALGVIGDNADNTVVVSRDGAGNILVNGGAVPIAGGTSTVSNTLVIRISGRAGNDQLSLDEANGALPKAEIFGEAGDDTLMGGNGADLLDGGPGDDSLLGNGGIDRLQGGPDDDTLTGGDGNDQVFGEAGNDLMVWNSGDDTDLIEGGTENDTAEVNGGAGNEQFTTAVNGTRVRFDRVNPAPFSLDIGTTETLQLNANGGADSFSASASVGALIHIVVDGGPGADNLTGSNGADVLVGGDDNDIIDGRQGNDVILMGSGADRFTWNPGDGNDFVDGEEDNDTLRFNGSNSPENFQVSRNGTLTRLTRDVGSVIVDFDSVEQLELFTLGGIDVTRTNDLAGTDLAGVKISLSSTVGGSGGDGVSDVVIVNGSAGDDTITATLSAGDIVVSGLAATVTVEAFDAAPTDSISVEGLGGHDIVDASALPAGGPHLSVVGGAGNDILLGGAGNDELLGGDNDDVLLGNGGADSLDGQAGNNTLIEDGNNVTSGIVSIFGDDLDDTITVSRDAGGNLFSNGVAIPGATVGNTLLIRLFGKGGNDTITLNEANGTLPPAMLFGGAGIDTLAGGSGADKIFGGIGNDTLLGRGGQDFLFGGANIDALTGGDADDQCFGEADNDRMVWNLGDDTDLNEGGAGSDTVEVNGGGSGELFTAATNGARVRFERLGVAPFALDIGTSERLVVNANAGNDSFSTTGDLAALGMAITVDGGAGDDNLLGSNGPDVLLGGDNNDFIDGGPGNDIALMGAGNDTFRWDPGDGDDFVDGDEDSDTLVFNGSSAAEVFEVSASGSAVRFTRNLAAIAMDLNGIEQLDLHALEGADSLTVNNLAGTDLSTLNLSLASTINGSSGDGQADLITVNGTAAADNISATAFAGVVTVAGLPTLVRITTPEAADDDLVLNGLGGTDSFSIGPGVSGLIGVTTNQ